MWSSIKINLSHQEKVRQIFFTLALSIFFLLALPTLWNKTRMRSKKENREDRKKCMIRRKEAEVLLVICNLRQAGCHPSLIHQQPNHTLPQTSLMELSQTLNIQLFLHPFIQRLKPEAKSTSSRCVFCLRADTECPVYPTVLRVSR